MATTSGGGGMVYTERVRNKRVVKPIIYGNSAMLLPMPKKNEKDHDHTHQWTIFIRSPDNNEDLSLYIRKVQFRLHESYPNNVRMVEKVPFQLTETGWGEFDIQVRLYFVDLNEKPVTFFHYLRLHAPIIELANCGKVVQKELYDEIVFNEPTEPMYRALMKYPHVKKPPRLELERKETQERLESANRQIIAEIEDLKRTLRDSSALVQKYRKELSEGDGEEGEPKPEEAQSSSTT